MTWANRSRRAFLAESSGAATLGIGTLLGGTPGLCGEAAESATALGLGSVRCEDFQAHRGEVFTVKLPGGALELRLADAVELPVKGAKIRRERAPFALRFQGEGARILPQETHPLEHPKLGTLHVFLVPVGPRTASQEYEAIFA